METLQRREVATLSGVDAAKYHLDGYNCAESVLLTFLDEWERYFRLGIDSSAATAFGGGIGRMGNICGALSGALIVIGLAIGRTDPKDDESKQKAYAAARELFQHFKEKWGTLTCRELTGCDLTTEEGREKFRNAKIPQTKCAPIVEETTKIVADIIKEIRKDP
jgi:C_GCAxxG_C_C family probable redox protein